MKWRHYFTLLVFLGPISRMMYAQDTTIQGVRVYFNYSTNTFPVEWQQAPINAKALNIDQQETRRSLSVTIKSLQKYPSRLLQKELQQIWWLKKMSFYDVGYGGTNSTNALYLTNEGSLKGYTNQYLEQTLHHEFSSILYRNNGHLFDTLSWKMANVPGFDYNDPEEGVGAIRNNASSQDLDSVLCLQGMLTQYAMSSMENDVNTFAQNLFCPAPGFWILVDRFPRVAKKARTMIQFYNKIDPIFTELYFRNLKAN